MTLRIGALVPLLAMAAASCGRHVAPPVTAPIADGTGWAYEVIADDEGRELGVLATFPAGTATTLSVDSPAARFVGQVEVADGEAWRPVASYAGAWTVPSCARGCTVRYRFLLGDAASALDDVDMASTYTHAIEAPPSTWLLRPTEFSAGIPYRFHVRTLGEGQFATGVRPIAGVADTYGADVTDLEMAPYTLFGRFRQRSVSTGGVDIRVAMLDGRLALDDAAVDRWIDLSVRAIDSFYGHFPVPRFLLVIDPASGGEAGGRTLASGGATIFLDVGAAMTADDVPRDWVLTHEMTHLALPTLPRAYHWLEEGLATYVEPIARAQVGTIPPEEVWRGLVDGLPKGLPAQGDRGLDRTHTWGRTYWGGAMFCLLADLAIRERTGNKKSLQDALRGIVDAGGTGEARWSIAEVLRTGDHAVGVPVLEELHALYGSTPVNVDLARIWAQLGVHVAGHGVAFDDRAPRAIVRRAITR